MNARSLICFLSILQLCVHAKSSHTRRISPLPIATGSTPLFFPPNIEHESPSKLSKSIWDQLYQWEPPNIEYKKTTDLERLPTGLPQFAKQTRMEQCESHFIPPLHAFDSYIGTPDEIEMIIPRNLSDLKDLFESRKYNKQIERSIDEYFWEFFGDIDSKESDDIPRDYKAMLKLTSDQYDAYLESKYGNETETRRALLKSGEWSAEQYSDYLTYNIAMDDERLLYSIVNQMATDDPNFHRNSRRLLSNFPSQWKGFLTFNGLVSDQRRVAYKSHTIKVDSREYWWDRHDCIQPKGCQVYPPMHVLHSGMVSCDQLMTELVLPLFECTKKYGAKDCPLIIDQGLFRWVIKGVLSDGRRVVLKMLKPRLIVNKWDILRHLRESILLNYLNRIEQTSLDSEGPQFYSQNAPKVFHFVPELGHCLYPTFMSVSPHYDYNLAKWIHKFGDNSTLETLMRMAIDIAKGVETIHSIPGGPYHHTDIQPKQFMVDNEGNVLINDFNRGKFQETYFDKNGNSERCWFCGHGSMGRYRAPEEHARKPLNEKLDIYSAGLSMWFLFTDMKPFGKLPSEDVEEIYRLGIRTPMPYNMPPAFKDIIRQTIAQNPRNRPSATELRYLLEDVYRRRSKITGDRQLWTSYELKSQKIWKEDTYIDINNYKSSSKKKRKRY